MTVSSDDPFREFMGVRWSRFLRSAYLLTGDPHVAKDLTQSAFERCYTAWRRVRQADDPDAYVRRILINLHRRRFRSPLREYLTDGGTAPGTPNTGPSSGARETVMERADTRLVMLKALSQLPIRQRQTLVLRFWEDLSVEQRALTRQCSTGTVKSQTVKALAHLRTVPELGDVLPKRIKEMT
ncbi:SigE family RNA polymerase sigma factor [Streptomyces sp. NPDC051320]|uniref:SigE family RNA polymerase sigma factor n=1 Tax=Streptomyces sp. NPDC051320 TaxID=3154644 RepID=UPI003430ECD4